ncbi:sensor histidine kinase [Microbulbifer epialgicus]|uniref:Sensor histidine kinase n=1 Tax=Microbulbifer epialgicus TaxID=393907 RepID=A0ABV4P386_9GAMM
MSGMFVYTPDPMHNQPLEAKLNLQLMLEQWQLSLYYIWQFSLMALVLFTYYWVNRYVLIRKVLANHRIYLFFLCSAIWLLLSYPLFGSLILQLPLNIPELSLLPSENHNPFDTLNLLVATIIWGIATPLILAFEHQQSTRELAEITKEQTQAELKMLQQQVNPHFLFNILNSLYALCLAQSGHAAPMLLKLSDLLRYVVYQGESYEVALKDDLAYLQNYLELQQMRVGSRCRIETNLQIPEEKLQIAPLLLIMLVENAFKHGVEVSPEECFIHISLYVQHTELVFKCINSLPDQAINPRANGIGLTNLKRRLQLSYPQRFTLLSETQGQQWHTRLTIQL